MYSTNCPGQAGLSFGPLLLYSLYHGYRTRLLGANRAEDRGMGMAYGYGVWIMWVGDLSRGGGGGGASINQIHQAASSTSSRQRVDMP